MTVPTSLTRTFDTSLVDVNRSFSSTETNTSGSSGKENEAPPAQVPPSTADSRHRNGATSDVYEQWASTYDTDGNALQAVDDLQMQAWIPEFVATLQRDANAGMAIAVLDLRCGTWRNTLQLLRQQWNRPVAVIGWNASPAMLQIARDK